MSITLVIWLIGWASACFAMRRYYEGPLTWVAYPILLYLMWPIALLLIWHDHWQAGRAK